MKKIIRFLIVFLLLIGNVTVVSAVDIQQTPSHIKGTQTLSYSIEYIGGGEAPYTENGVTYYRSDNVIQLSIILPENSYVAAVHAVTSFDENQLELISSFSQIKLSSDSGISDDFTLLIDKFMEQTNRISIKTYANNTATSANVSGGAVAKIKFKVKANQETTAGSSIQIQNQYQLAAYVNNELQFVHVGWNDAATGENRFASASPVVIAAHKTPSSNSNNSNNSNNNGNVENPSIAPGEMLTDKLTSENKPIDKEVIKDLFEEHDISPEVLEKIIEVTGNNSYSFSRLSDGVHGLDDYDSILNDLRAKKIGNDSDTIYKTSSFGEVDEATANPLSEAASNNYYMLFLLFSILVVIGTMSYDYYKNYKLKESMRI